MWILRLFPRKKPQVFTSKVRPTPVIPSPDHPPQSSGGFFEGRTGKDATGDIKAVSLDLVQTLTSLAVEVAEVVPVPGLKAGLLALAEVIKKIQAMQVVVEGADTLNQRTRSLIESLIQLREQFHDHQLPGGMQARIEELAAAWGDIGKRAAKIKSRGKVVRFLRSSRDAQKLGELAGEINDSIQDKVMLRGILDIETYILQIYQEVKQINIHLEASFLPNYAKMAQFDSNQARNPCLQGTRVDILCKIRAWIVSACAHGQRIPDDGIVFWISGFGGTGKTTIACSVSELCEQLRILGATFFCSRHDSECSDPNLIFLTLCRQLCHRHARFKEKVEAILKEKPDIVNCGPYRQFEELFVRPVEELGKEFRRLVIVLDALDECKDESATSTILSVIAKYMRRISPFLLFVITSRREEHITAVFDKSRANSLSDTTTPLLLHEVPLDTTLEDIKRYLDHKFNDYIGVLGVKKGWPMAAEKNRLAVLSRGLFIYVATAVKFIMDKEYANPKGRLRSLLKSRPNSSTPREFLFNLYSTVMVASCKQASPELVDNIRVVLGTVVLAQEPLSPSAIARLLNVDEDTVRNSLTRLHSVIHVPVDSNEPIRIIHPTFPEFLLQSSESSPLQASVPISVSLHLQAAERHALLFLRCIETMNGALKRDMIGIRHPARLQSEITNLRERVAAAFQPHVSYACRFWGVHFRDSVEAAATLDIVTSFDNFVHRTLLYWLEACSLLDATDTVISTLDIACKVCQIPGGLFSDFAPLLVDCRRFASAYSPCIQTAPLQIYYAALSIAPAHSHIRKTYAHECKNAVVVHRGRPANWATCLDTFLGHGGHPVIAVAFSPDGSSFVTGGSDKKATVWKATTRRPIVSFYGHSNQVSCVAYASDGLFIASGSWDAKVYVWRALSGECTHTLKGHTGRVVSVSFSEDGRHIVSGTHECEVKLWNTIDGRCLLTLDKTSNWTVQVGISPDSSVIARGDGKFLRLHNLLSSTSAQLEFPDEVVACTFSPDGRYIAARTMTIIRILSCSDKSLVRTIESPKTLIGPLVFSPDSTFIGCSGDGGAFLWSVASEGSPRTMSGDTSPVWAIACSPDGYQLVSTSFGGTIRVWDPTSLSIPVEGYTALETHPSSPGPPRFALVRYGERSVALLYLPTFSIDAERFLTRTPGAPVATLFADMVSAWDAALQTDSLLNIGPTDWNILTGRRHFHNLMRPLAISSDGALVAYLSPVSDTVVDICDLYTGTVVAILAGHSWGINSIAFSPDNTRLATGSGFAFVKLWDIRTGALVCSHNQHRYGFIRTVAFSPDGCLLASGSDDGTVRILEVETRPIMHVLRLHQQRTILHVMFAADDIHLMALDGAQWIHVWDVTTGALIREFSFGEDGWLRSSIFSPDGAGIIVGDTNEASHSVSFWKPGTRAWPVYHITRDGWVYAMGPGKTRRLCWLPPEWRTILGSDGGILCIREVKSEGYEKKRLIVLDISQLAEYIDTLDAELQ